MSALWRTSRRRAVAVAAAMAMAIAVAAATLDRLIEGSAAANLRLGQPAEVRSDLYGGSFIFHGRVMGMSAGTGAAFALLPAQNASGNWIKVVQRVPVRIQIDADDLATSPLRVGLSATVTVNTANRDGPVLATKAADKAVGDTQVYASDLAQANTEADAIVSRNLGAED